MTKGWNFPVGINPQNGGIMLTDLKEDIRQSIMILLKTRPGERYFHPNYGCDLQRFLFETVNYELIKSIRLEVLSAVNRWEKRVSNVDVALDLDDENPSLLLIYVAYAIPELKEADKIVLPFDLMNGN